MFPAPSCSLAYPKYPKLTRAVNIASPLKYTNNTNKEKKKKNLLNKMLEEKRDTRRGIALKK